MAAPATPLKVSMRDPSPNQRVRLSVLLILALGFVAASARPGAFAPKSGVVVQAGTPVATPRRIISLVPAVTEMLFAMGAGSDVVGVSSYDTFPPEVKTRPQVGALVDPDFERILTLRPDLVIVYATQDDLLARLDRSRIPMFRYQHATLADITKTMRDLGVRIGRPAAGQQLAVEVDRGLDAVRAGVAGQPRPRTALIFGREAGSLRSIWASGGYGFLHDLLEVAGGTDVFADIHRESLQVSTEVMLARAPDVIVEIHPTSTSWTREAIQREIRVWQGMPSLPAVARQRIAILADDRLFVPGPRVAEAAQLIAQAIHPR